MSILTTHSYIIPIVVLFLCFLIKIPISYSLFSASIVYCMFMGLDLGTICEKTMSTLYFKYVILAVPLFIFTANVLNSSKVSDYIFGFCKALIGKRKGALAYVNVLISLIFSGMSGSAFADASGIGKIEIDAMQKDGYDDEFSCALTAATSTVGPVFPPSLNLVTFAMLSGASVGSPLLAGVVPAVLMCVILAIYVAYISNKRNYPTGSKYPFKEFVRYTAKALPALLTPVILLTCIYTGVVTPTEAACVSSGYALLLAVIVYRTMDLKGVWNCFRDTAKGCGSLLMLICASTPFSYVITVSGFGDIITDMFLSITNNKYVFLLLVNVLFLVLGMFLDTSTITFVVLPLLLPVVESLDIDLVHFGIIYTVNTLAGMCTPPYGMLCFLSAGICGANLKGVFREAVPMVAMLLIVLLLITYIPAISLLVPGLA